MFFVTDKTIDERGLRASLENHSGGAFVSFEGRVRKHNDGRVVERLEYELFPELCVLEGERILEEARKLFPILEVVAVHRYGTLELGESAVWVGVVTSHRGAGFQACRFIIDSIKSRCPIWKKETYVDGPSEWVGCPTCEHHAVAAPKVFSRQTKLIGKEGQKALKDARVLVIGAGGLGCPVALNLAAAGVGFLRLVDPDRLDPTNLHRQTLYGFQDVGSPKALLAKRRLEELHPFTTIEARVERFDETSADDLLKEIDLVLECSDNFHCKFLVNDLAVKHKVPYIQASIFQNEAQITSYDPELSACLRCEQPVQPPADCVESCTESGVLGAATSIVGSHQALEALRYLVGQKPRSLTATIHLDLTTFENIIVERSRDKNCPSCSPSASLDFVYEDSLLYPGVKEEGSWSELREISNSVWIDIRERDEHDHRIEGAKNLPLSEFYGEQLDAYRDRTVILFCQKGKRSRGLLEKLIAEGMSNVKALRGGVDSLRD